MDRTLEKVALAKELGLNAYVTSYEQKAINEKNAEERRMVIEEITKMKFEPLTKASFNLFPKWKFDLMEGFTGWNNRLTIIFIAGAVSTFIGITGFFAKEPSALAAMCLIFGVSIIPILIYSFWECFRKVFVTDMPLNNWASEIPYGALLAIKHAKEQGIIGWTDNYGRETFKIHYPIIRERVKADPIITGRYKGVEVIIFAWDDSKVYE